MRRTVTVSHNHTQSRTRGFSLPELIGVLAVAGLSVSLAVPSYQFLLRTDRQSEAVNRLLTTLQVARSSAITRNTTITVCASLGGKSCDGHSWEDGWLAWSNADAGADGVARHVLLSETAQPGMQIQSREFAKAIEFHANGGASAPDTGAISGQFVFCPAGSATASREIVVLPHGKMAVTSPGVLPGPSREPVGCRPENRS
jgi:type IV fimbrial biogenesis protein FimT